MQVELSVSSALSSDNTEVILRRAEAKHLGLARYFTGKKCKHGHLSQRLVSNGSCIVCADDRQRRSRRDNPEKWREYDRLQYERDPEKARALSLDWRNRNINRARKSLRRWKAENPERVIQQALVDTARRRARKRAAPGNHTLADIDRLIELQRGRCAHPGCRKSIRSVRHVDHIKPLVLGGSNGPENLQLLCPEHNMAKGAKDPMVFAQLNGRLL